MKLHLYLFLLFAIGCVVYFSWGNWLLIGIILFSIWTGVGTVKALNYRPKMPYTCGTVNHTNTTKSDITP